MTALKNLSPAELAARASDHLPPWVALALAVLLAWQLAKLTWMLFPGSEADLTPIPAAAATTAVTGPGSRFSFDVNRVIGSHLFGEQPAEPVAVVTPPVEDIDDTELRLTLTGIMAANEDRMAMAIIADDRGEEKVYAIGDAVTGGRKLHAVLPDRAILDNNGELEALRLPREYDDSASRTTARSQRSLRPSDPRQSTARLQQTLAKNPAKLTDLIRPQPVFSNGKQLGYRVYPGRRRQQFLELGLKPGDLLTEINGTPLDDPARGADIFRSLADANQVSVTVERNGSPQVLVLDPEQLNLDSETRR